MTELQSLLKRQLAGWPEAARRYRDLREVQTKEITIGGMPVRVQYNPARAVSTLARTDAASIAARPCFLCRGNRPQQQEALPFEGCDGRRYEILVNPFPIFPEHFTVPAVDHVPQRIAGRFPDMLRLADAITAGIPADTARALKAMVRSSSIPYYEGTGEMMRLGYVPMEASGSSASVTLEYAYDDWTVYKTAADAGQSDIAEQYLKRSGNWRNVFDPGTLHARPRHEDGTFKTDFDLLSTHGQGFIEGNSLNYSFYVPHDVPGLIEAMGGAEQFEANLDTLFTMHLPDEFFAGTEDVTREGILGGYVHGNEPSHHIPFLYAWTSSPWKTQYWQREIMNRMYRNNIDGLCGNDDCGQMSAWYIFSAMGFYPVCPGSGEYILGAPYLPYMRINLENGRTLEIKAPKVSDRNRYVRSVSLNGTRLKPGEDGVLKLTIGQILAGGLLEFEMTARH